MSEQILQPEIVEDKSTINIIVRKETNYGRHLYYPVNKDDEWITIIQNQEVQKQKHRSARYFESTFCNGGASVLSYSRRY